MGVIIYNGQSSEDFGLHVSYRPDYDIPVRDVEEITLPGRDGVILYDNGRYNPTERPYAITFGDEDMDFYLMAKKVSKWLNSSNSKFVRLSDSYEPDVYRLARYIPDGPIIPVLENGGGIVAKFQCLPQRFYNEGDKPLKYEMGPVGSNLFDENDYSSTHNAYELSLTALSAYLLNPYIFAGDEPKAELFYLDGVEKPISINLDGTFISPITGTVYLRLIDVYYPDKSIVEVWDLSLPDFTITNYTNENSKPIVKIIPKIPEGSLSYGVYLMSLNDTQIKIDTRVLSYNGTIIIDCERKDCYSPDFQNLNEMVTFTKNNQSVSFPEFIPGANTFRFQSMVYDVNVEVIPKWWTI